MKISNPRLLAGNAALATQQYVNRASGDLSQFINSEISSLSATTSGIISSVSGTLYSTIENVENNLNTTISTASATLDTKIDEKIDSVSGTVSSNFVQKTEYNKLFDFFENTTKIKPEYLPPISITDVVPIKLQDILEEGQRDIYDNPTQYFITYLNKNLSGILQEGDVVIVAPSSYIENVNTNAENTYNENYDYGQWQTLVGPWIVTKPELQNNGTELSGNINVIKLTFPTTELRSINGLLPNENGNITFMLSSLADYKSSQLSALYNVAYDDTLKRLASWTPGVMADTKIFYATTGEVDYVSGELDTIKAKTEELTSGLSALSGNVNTNQANIDNIYTATLASAFFVDSIKFSPSGIEEANTTTISSTILNSGFNIKKDIFNVNEFDKSLKIHKFNISNFPPKQSEILSIYGVTGTRQENLYPDIIIENGETAISFMIEKEEDLPAEIKVVFSNYNDIKKF